MRRPHRKQRQEESQNDNGEKESTEYVAMSLKILAVLILLGVHLITNLNLKPNELINQMKMQVKSSRRTTTITANATMTIDQARPSRLIPKTLSSCRRQCDNFYKNRIIFHGRKAGIVDREGALFSLSNIAAYLCAKVLINPLTNNLQPSHNFGRPTPSDMRFESLVNISIVCSGKTAFEEMMSTDTNAHVNRTEFDTHIGTNRPAQAVTNFLKAEDTVHNNQSFVWEISSSSNYYKWFGDLSRLFQQRTNASMEEHAGLDIGIIKPTGETALPLLDSSAGTFVGCPYTRLSFPQPIQQTADQIYNLLLPESQTRSTTLVGYLHVRQGDVASACPTNSSELQRYLSCSLKNTEKLGGNITLLFSSDLRDEGEREVWRKLEIYPHVELQDLDAIVQQELQHQVDREGAPQYYLTSFYIFQVVRAIKQKADFRWQRRKAVCPSCDQLPSHLLQNEESGTDPPPPLSLYGQFT